MELHSTHAFSARAPSLGHHCQFITISYFHYQLHTNTISKRRQLLRSYAYFQGIFWSYDNLPSTIQRVDIIVVSEKRFIIWLSVVWFSGGSRIKSNFFAKMGDFMFNIDGGYLEGLCRGFKCGILKQADYLNLVQCETLEGLYQLHLIIRVWLFMWCKSVIKSNFSSGNRCVSNEINHIHSITWNEFELNDFFVGKNRWDYEIWC